MNTPEKVQPTQEQREWARRVLCDFWFEMPFSAYEEMRLQVENGLEHFGDCTHMPVTCIKCMIEDNEKDVAKVAHALAEREANLQAQLDEAVRKARLEEAELRKRECCNTACELMCICDQRLAALRAVER